MVSLFLPSPKNPSGHPMKYTFTQTVWLLTAIMVIYEYLEHVELFTQSSQFVPH